MENTFEIQDKNGCIHSGDETEMREAFDVMILSMSELMNSRCMGKKKAFRLKEAYQFEWEGDLKLVEVHNIYR